RVHAVRVALEGERPVLQVRHHPPADARVVVDHVGLGEPGRGVEHLVQVGQLELPALEFDQWHRGAESYRARRRRRSRAAAFGLVTCLAPSCCSRLLRSASIRSTTLACFSAGAKRISLPLDLSSISASTFSRYSSWYFPGWNFTLNESISWRAMDSSRSAARGAFSGSPSTSSPETISSA